jgi:hypothetical protein
MKASPQQKANYHLRVFFNARVVNIGLGSVEGKPTQGGSSGGIRSNPVLVQISNSLEPLIAVNHYAAIFVTAEVKKLPKAL